MTDTHRTRPTHTKTNPALRLLNWLAEHDRHYREMQKLRRMSDARLADMGLTRADAETAQRRTGTPKARRTVLGALRRS